MAGIKNYSFPKNEKLKNKKQIDLVFREGKSFFAAPVKCFFRLKSREVEKLVDEPTRQGDDTKPIYNNPQTIYIQAGFSVSKKQFKNAVDRNRVKRLMREAFRLHKQKLSEQATEKGIMLEVFFVFTDRTLPAFSLVEEKIKYCLRRLVKIVEGNV